MSIRLFTPRVGAPPLFTGSIDWIRDQNMLVSWRWGINPERDSYPIKNGFNIGDGWSWISFLPFDSQAKWVVDCCGFFDGFSPQAPQMRVQHNMLQLMLPGCSFDELAAIRWGFSCSAGIEIKCAGGLCSWMSLAAASRMNMNKCWMHCDWVRYVSIEASRVKSQVEKDVEKVEMIATFQAAN